MSSKQSIHWPTILLEALFLVLGVVLALSANTLRENLQNEKRAESALTSILDEVAHNHRLISESISYHGGLFDTLNTFIRQYGQDPSQKPGFALFSRGYVAPASTVSSAWQTTVTTGIVEHLSYSDVLKLSEIYEHQDRYEYQARLISQTIYGMLLQEGPRSIIDRYQNLTNIIGTFLYRECSLANELSETLASYGKTNLDLSVPEGCTYIPRR